MSNYYVTGECPANINPSHDKDTPVYLMADIWAKPHPPFSLRELSCLTRPSPSLSIVHPSSHPVNNTMLLSVPWHIAFLGCTRHHKYLHSASSALVTVWSFEMVIISPDDAGGESSWRNWQSSCRPLLVTWPACLSCTLLAYLSASLPDGLQTTSFLSAGSLSVTFTAQSVYWVRELRDKVRDKYQPCFLFFPHAFLFIFENGYGFSHKLLLTSGQCWNVLLSKIVYDLMEIMMGCRSFSEAWEFCLVGWPLRMFRF